MKQKPWLVFGAIGIGAVLAAACGSDDDGGSGGPSTSGGGTTTQNTSTVTNTTTGSPSTITGGPSSGGSGGSGGGAGAGGSGGTGTGGSGGTGTGGTGTGGSGGTGTGGSAGGGGEAGGAGMAGMAGMGGEGPDPLSCEGIPSRALGDDDEFSIASPDFDHCDPLPEDTTCEGKPFPESVSPELRWTEGPEGTLSYAISFTDLTILETRDPAAMNYNQGYLWVIWDIPADTRTLPAELESGHLSTEIDGARQWAQFNDYGFRGACPNLPTQTPPLNNDSHSFTVYAMPTATLEVPEVVDGQTFARAMDNYLRDNALAAAEYRGTSNAQASEILAGTFPPDAEVPCPSEGDPPPGCLTGE